MIVPEDFVCFGGFIRLYSSTLIPAYSFSSSWIIWPRIYLCILGAYSDWSNVKCECFTDDVQIPSSHLFGWTKQSLLWCKLVRRSFWKYMPFQLTASDQTYFARRRWRRRGIVNERDIVAINRFLKLRQNFVIAAICVGNHEEKLGLDRHKSTISYLNSFIC